METYADIATVENGGVMLDGRRIEPATNNARNQFGYEHGFTWAEAATMGIPIWVEDDGAIWCDDSQQ